MEIAAAILHPFLLQVAGHDCDLVGTRTDRAFEIHPVGICGDVVVLARCLILQFRQSGRFLQSVAVAGAVIDQLHVLKISNERQITAVDEAPVVHDVAIGSGIDKSRVWIRQREVERDAAVRRQRLREAIDVEAQRRIFNDRCLPAFQAEHPHLHVRARNHIHILRPDGHRHAVDCGIGLVLQPLLAAEDGEPLFGKEVNIHLHVGQPWLWHRLVLLVLDLVLRPRLLNFEGREIGIQNVRVVVNVAAHCGKEQPERRNAHACRRREARSRQLQPIAQAGFHAAHPQ